jgi:hypothetical protein
MLGCIASQVDSRPRIKPYFTGVKLVCPWGPRLMGAITPRLDRVDDSSGYPETTRHVCDSTRNLQSWTGDDMGKVSERIKEEFLAVIPPTIFFLFTLGVVAVVRMLMLKGTGIPASSPIQVALGALVLGKSVLIADMLPIMNRYPEKPLVYNVAWKTVIYVLVALVIHYLERLVEFWKQAGGFIAGNEKMLAEMVWPHFWAIQILLVVLIFDYCVMHELVRVIGGKKVREMFFGDPANVAS